MRAMLISDGGESNQETGYHDRDHRVSMFEAMPTRGTENTTEQ